MPTPITLTTGADFVTLDQGPNVKINTDPFVAWNDQVIDGSAGFDTLIVDENSTKASYFTVAMTHDGIVTLTAASGAGSKYVSFTNFEKISFWDVIMNLGTAGNDVLTGGAFADSIYSFDGNDTLNGGTGNFVDKLFGGAGDDTYIVAATNDIITELVSEGTDTVKSSATYSLADTDGTGTNGGHVENLTLTGAAAINGAGNARNNILTGNGAINTLTGDLGNDTIDGGLGNDNMNGGAGNDTYFVDSLGDAVTELTGAGSGADTILSSITYSLVDTDGAGANGGNVENLTLTGLAAIDGTGNDLDNILTGNSTGNKLSGGLGKDTIDGGGGADTMAGGAGNDSYTVDRTADVITELKGGGSDSVKSSVSYTLSANVENLTLAGTLAIDATGNIGKNVLIGNKAANIITGGKGQDVMTGGLGADTFDFNSTLDSAATLKHDLIKDFVHLTDKIDLLTIDADTTNTGNGTFTFLVGLGTAFKLGMAGQVHFVTSGANTLIEGDTNGDAIADFQIELTGIIALTGADFML